MSVPTATDRLKSPAAPPEAAPPTALAPADVAGAPAPYNPFGASVEVWTNLPMSTEEGRRIFAMARLMGGGPADEHIGAELALMAVVIYPVEITDKETGEIATLPRTVLCLADGTYLGFVSKGVIDSLATIMMIHGRGPWTPYIRVRLTQVKLGQNRRTYKLIPLFADTPAKPRSK